MSDLPLTPTEPRRGLPRWGKWLLIAIPTLVVLFFGAIFLYAKVINDAPDEFSSDDLSGVLSGVTTAPQADAATTVGVPATTAAAAAPGATTAAPTVNAATTAPAAPVTTAAAPAGGATNWTATTDSQVGYRVQEVLFGVDTTAVGRTNAVTGSLSIAGTQLTAAEFTVDVATITSPESKRDEQFRGRIMSTDEFPTATFALTQPVELGTEPVEGAQVTASATGDLTLRGVTQTVTFDVTALLQNGLIGVQGSIPVVFADYSIENPSVAGITTEDNGLVEFILVFQPA